MELREIIDKIKIRFNLMNPSTELEKLNLEIKKVLKAQEIYRAKIAELIKEIEK